MSFLRVNSQLRAREGEIANVMRIKNFKITEQVGELAVYVIKKLAPVGITGELRRSVKILATQKRQADGRYEGNIKVGPTAKHARFVIKGTRYITPNNFVKRAKPIIMAETNRIVEQHYGRGKFNVTKYFRLGQ